MNLPEIWPSMVEVKNVRKNWNGWPIYDWVYKMAGMKLQGEQDTTEFIENKHTKTVSTKGVESQFVFDYCEQAGTTKLDLLITYSVPIPLVQKIAEQVVGKISEHEADV